MNKIIFINIFLFFNTFGFDFYKKKNITIMLNPAGDAKIAGRIINDNFERGLTLQFVQELKKNLELELPDIRIVISRIPGENLEPLQNANFSNRLNADLFLSFHFYKETSSVNQVYLYHYLINPFFIKLNSNLDFFTFDYAFLFNVDKTIEFAKILKDAFSSNENNYKFKNLYGIPFKPLTGVIAPAIAIEIGLGQSYNFSAFFKPIIQAIKQIFQ